MAIGSFRSDLSRSLRWHTCDWYKMGTMKKRVCELICKVHQQKINCLGWAALSDTKTVWVKPKQWYKWFLMTLGTIIWYHRILVSSDQSSSIETWTPTVNSRIEEPNQSLSVTCRQPAAPGPWSVSASWQVLLALKACWLEYWWKKTPNRFKKYIRSMKR